MNTYELHLACLLGLQYLWLEKGEKTEARAEKKFTNSESSQIDVIEMQRKKYRSTNSNLRMQKGFREDLLKILKSYEDLQRSASKADGDNFNNFKSDSELSESSPENFEDASEGEIEFKAFSEDFNENQLKVE